MKKNPCDQHANMAAQVSGEGYSCIYCMNAENESKLEASDINVANKIREVAALCAQVDALETRLSTLLNAARFTLTEQRREFERGSIPDLDQLEDAISACGVDGPVETCANCRSGKMVAGTCDRCGWEPPPPGFKVGTFPSEPHPDVKRWPLGPVQIYPDVESTKPCPHCGFTLNRNEPYLLCHKCQKPLDVERQEPESEFGPVTITEADRVDLSYLKGLWPKGKKTE